MKDVFGDALQKLTPLPKPSVADSVQLQGSEAEVGESPSAAIQAASVQNGCTPTSDAACPPNVESEISSGSWEVSVTVTTSGISLTEPVEVPCEHILPFAVAQSSSAIITQTAPELEPSLAAKSVGDTVASEEMPADATVPISSEVSAANAARSRLEFILDHRRQTAAVVVLICLAIFLFDDGREKSRSGALSKSAAQSSTSPDDMLLSDFDAVEVRTLREPADPVETVTPDPFAFSISPAAWATTEHDRATATQASTTGHDTRRTGNRAGSSHSEHGPASSSVSLNARLTGQIQPMQ
jgi:hypothetical protein